ncbi:hypothetical protein VNI00_017384 [Paramarasmius palmivorus]|uniref:Integral membrane protein n=1 Tax=Paramarasmius palmivorus TaxID=297713 RepID=A0AAW0B6W3_9AGAR
MWDVLTQVFGLSTAFLSDTMLMHRCYIIWGSSRRIAVLMITALITVVAVIQAVMTTFIAPQYPSKQMLTSYLSFTFRVTNTVFNFGLTGLTAGRIWWIARRIDMQKKYCTIVAILLESGIIYPMVQILDLTFNYVIFPQQSRAPGFPFDLFEVVYHACGIAPALIIVRAEARKTVETEVSEL